MQLYEIVGEFLLLHGHGDLNNLAIQGDDYTGIDPNKVDILTDAIQDFIANVVATLIDAGSERDAVNENEELRQAIRKELDGWKYVKDVQIGEGI